MNAIRTFILKFLLGSKIRQLLDLLPFNGKKSILCILVTCLAVLASVGLGSTFNLDTIMRFLEGLGGVSVLSSADITALVGAMATLISILHKVLKWLEGVPQTGGPNDKTW